MTRKFGFKPSTIPDGQYAVGICLRCRNARYLTRALMLEKAGDIPLDRIEPRLRCVARPVSDKRGPACGGRMTLGLDGPILNSPEANAAYPSFEPGQGGGFRSRGPATTPQPSGTMTRSADV